MVNHLNWAENRAYFKQVRLNERRLRRESAFLWGFTVAFLILILFLGSGCACASNLPLNDENAVKAIIGEAESEGWMGMRGIAFAIRNRGNLKGVYGLNSPRVKKHKYSDVTYKMAVRQWRASAIGHDITNGATGWGSASDLVKFKRQGWFKHCVITAHISNHYFYKEVR